MLPQRVPAQVADEICTLPTANIRRGELPCGQPDGAGLPMAPHFGKSSADPPFLMMRDLLAQDAGLSPIMLAPDRIENWRPEAAFSPDTVPGSR